MMRFLRSAFVIARRDFAATVLSKTFIFFLLGPLFPLLLGGVFGGIGARVATQTERPVVAVIAPQAEFERARSPRATQLARRDRRRCGRHARRHSPEGDLDAQRKRLLASRRSADPRRARAAASTIRILPVRSAAIRRPLDQLAC